MTDYWWSVEVFDAPSPGADVSVAFVSADRWREAWGAALVEAAISHGAQDWNWHRTDWGMVFEVLFAEPEQWTVFRTLPVVTAALDATPDPVNGIMIYPGRGGASSSRMPRRPKPIVGGGAAPLPSSPPPIHAATAHLAREAHGSGSYESLTAAA